MQRNFVSVNILIGDKIDTLIEMNSYDLNIYSYYLGIWLLDEAIIFRFKFQQKLIGEFCGGTQKGLSTLA